MWSKHIGVRHWRAGIRGDALLHTVASLCHAALFCYALRPCTLEPIDVGMSGVVRVDVVIVVGIVVCLNVH